MCVWGGGYRVPISSNGGLIENVWDGYCFFISPCMIQLLISSGHTHPPGCFLAMWGINSSDAAATEPLSAWPCQSQATTRWQAAGAASSFSQASSFLTLSYMSWLPRTASSLLASRLLFTVNIYASTQFVLSACLEPAQRSNSPFLWGGYLHTSWQERLSRMTLNLCQNSSVRAWTLQLHLFVIIEQKVQEM